MQTTIYRTGPMTVGTHGEDILQDWYEFDVRRPTGHLRRQDAIYAAPDIQGGHHWLYSIAFYRDDEVLFNEITVESDNVRVYSIAEYNLVGKHEGNPNSTHIEHIENYWASSMTLTEWLRNVGEDPFGEWEVLLPKEEVISSRVLSYPEMEELYLEEGLEDSEILSELQGELREKLEPVFS